MYIYNKWKSLKMSISSICELCIWILNDILYMSMVITKLRKISYNKFDGRELSIFREIYITLSFEVIKNIYIKVE